MTSRCRTLGADDVLTRTSTVTLYVTPFNRGSFFFNFLRRMGNVICFVHDS